MCVSGWLDVNYVSLPGALGGQRGHCIPWDWSY